MKPIALNGLEFGEDLAGNLRDAVAVARLYCRNCADYHIIHAAVRVAGRRAAATVDRDVISDVIRNQIVGRETADIVIAGSADSALLAMTARGVSLAVGGREFGRFRFTVIDRCGTPLEFCRRYGQRHGLTVITRVAEIGEEPTGIPADILLVHSMLRFLPRERHAGVLAALAQSLRPGGRIVFSQGLGVSGGGGELVDRAKLRALMESGEIILPEPLAEFIARLTRQEAAARKPRADYETEAEMRDLFARARLHIVDRKLVGRPDAPRRRRVVAVLAAGQ